MARVALERATGPRFLDTPLCLFPTTSVSSSNSECLKTKIPGSQQTGLNVFRVGSPTKNNMASVFLSTNSRLYYKGVNTKNNAPSKIQTTGQDQTKSPTPPPKPPQKTHRPQKTPADASVRPTLAPPGADRRDPRVRRVRRHRGRVGPLELKLQSCHGDLAALLEDFTELKRQANRAATAKPPVFLGFVSGASSSFLFAGPVCSVVFGRGSCK